MADQTQNPERAVILKPAVDDLGRPLYGWLPGVSHDGYLAHTVRHEHDWEEQITINHRTNWWCRHPGCYTSWLTKEEDDHG